MSVWGGVFGGARLALSGQLYLLYLETRPNDHYSSVLPGTLDLQNSKEGLWYRNEETNRN